MNEKGQFFGGHGFLGLRINAQRAIASWLIGIGIVLIVIGIAVPTVVVLNLPLAVIGVLIEILGIGLTFASG